MAEPKLQLLPERHTDFALAIELDGMAWLLLGALALAAILLVRRARRRRR